MNQLIQDLLSDLRYAFRQFRKSPGFTATALITLTLGIGISTAAFTLMYGMILRRLPVPHPEQLYRLGDYSSNYSGIGGVLNSGGVFQEFSYNLYLDLK